MDATPDAQARVHHSAWRWLIWALPLAALGITAGVMIPHWLASGPTVEVHFPTLAGISKDSEVRYRGVKVGTVDSVEVGDHLQDVVAKLSLDGPMSQALRSGTLFWIAQPTLSEGGVTQLLGGAYIGIEPGEGSKTKTFTGLLHPPIVKPQEPGTAVVLYCEKAQGIGDGASVFYRGLHAGHVLGVTYEPKEDRVRVDVLVQKPFAGAVHAKSRFWQQGGISLGGNHGGPSIPPLGQLVSGGIAFETPQDSPGAPARDGEAFTLYRDQAIAERQLTGPAVVFETVVPGAVGGLEPGAAVKLEGVEVGLVQHVGLRFDAQHGTLETPVTFAIEPARLGLGDADAQAATARLMDAMSRLVDRGLHAQVGSSSLILGSKQLELVIAPGSVASHLDLAAKPPQIPAMVGGSLQGVVASAGRIEDHLDTLVTNLNRATGGSLRSQEDIGTLIQELTRAARSVRILADYLEQHPESLLQGRPAQ